MNTVNKIFANNPQHLHKHLRRLPSIALSFIVALLLTSAVSVLPVQAQTNEARNLQTVINLYNGPFKTGGFALFYPVTASNFVRHSPEGDFNSEAYATATIAQRASFKNVALTPLVVFADGDWVAVNSTYSGLFAKDFPIGGGKSIPATQKSIAFDVIVFYHFNDQGLLTEMWEEYDSLNIYMQLGAIPTPEGVTISAAVIPPTTFDPRSMVQPGTALMRETITRKLTSTVEEAFGQGVFDPNDIIASPDFIVHPSEENLGQFTQNILNLRAAMPDLKVTVAPVIVEGNWAAVRVVTSGTFSKGLIRADGSIIPPTNKTVTMSQNDILRFDQNGNDAEQWTAQDNLSLLVQLGVMPASPVTRATSS